MTAERPKDIDPQIVLADDLSHPDSLYRLPAPDMLNGLQLCIEQYLQELEHCQRKEKDSATSQTASVLQQCITDMRRIAKSYDNYQLRLQENPRESYKPSVAFAHCLSMYFTGQAYYLLGNGTNPYDPILIKITDYLRDVIFAVLDFKIIKGGHFLLQDFMRPFRFPEDSTAEYCHASRQSFQQSLTRCFGVEVLRLDDTEDNDDAYDRFILALIDPPAEKWLEALSTNWESKRQTMTTYRQQAQDYLLHILLRYRIYNILRSTEQAPASFSGPLTALWNDIFVEKWPCDEDYHPEDASAAAASTNFQLQEVSAAASVAIETEPTSTEPVYPLQRRIIDGFFNIVDRFSEDEIVTIYGDIQYVYTLSQSYSINWFIYYYEDLIKFANQKKLANSTTDLYLLHLHQKSLSLLQSVSEQLTLIIQFKEFMDTSTKFSYRSKHDRRLDLAKQLLEQLQPALPHASADNAADVASAPALGANAARSSQGASSVAHNSAGTFGKSGAGGRDAAHPISKSEAQRPETQTKQTVNTQTSCST